MRTLYIRNVPEDVAEAIEDLARGAGISVNTFVNAQLAELAGRSRNAAILAALPSLDIDPAEVVEAIREGRRERERQIDRLAKKRDRR